MFLRAFADYFIDIANERGAFCGNIQIVKPRAGGLERFAEQACVYTVIPRGGPSLAAARVITSVSGAISPYGGYASYSALARNPDLRFVISNVTETGICFSPSESFSKTPPETFPAKLTKLLYERFVAFGGAESAGLIMLPAELINENGAALCGRCAEYAALWGLGGAFSSWLETANIFCDTLVDRVVAGFPDDPAVIESELGYSDGLMVLCEPYALWVIAPPPGRAETVMAEFPLHRAGLPVVFTSDIAPFRERKVGVLNAAHTLMAHVGLLRGIETVSGFCENPETLAFLKELLFGDLAPNAPEGAKYAETVLARFSNPYINHKLSAIAQNIITKFHTRVLPVVEKSGGNAPRVAFSAAALLWFFKTADKAFFSAEKDALAHGFLNGPGLSRLWEKGDFSAVAKAFFQNGGIWSFDFARYPFFIEQVAARAGAKF